MAGFQVSTGGRIWVSTEATQLVPSERVGWPAAHLDLTRFRGRPTRPSFGAEVAQGIESESRAA